MRIELQKRCNILEVEAINILNGYHIQTYVHKYGVLSGRIKDPKADSKEKSKAAVKISKGQSVEDVVAGVKEEIEYWKNQAQKDDGFSFEERD